MIQEFLEFIFLFRCVVSGSGKITMHVLEKLIAYDSRLFPFQYQVILDLCEANVLNLLRLLWFLYIFSILKPKLKLVSITTFQLS